MSRNSSMITADRATHLKIVVVALVVGIAVAVAALTVYDMAKAVDRSITFTVELVEKVKG